MTWEGLNRRRFPRIKFPCLVKVIVNGVAIESHLTHTENISIGGICVIIKSGLERFAPVDLEIDLMDGNDHIACHGRVMWVVRRKGIEELKPYHYETGIEFVDIAEKERKRISYVVDHLFKTEKKAGL